MARTIQEAAAGAGVGVSSVKRAIKDGLLKRDQHGRFNLQEVRDACEARSARRGRGEKRFAENTGGMAPELIELNKEIRKDELALIRARRKTVELALGVEDGSYLQTSEVTFTWVQLFIELRDALHYYPDQMAGLCAMRPAREVAPLLRRRLDEILDEFASKGRQANAELGTPKKPK